MRLKKRKRRIRNRLFAMIGLFGAVFFGLYFTGPGISAVFFLCSLVLLTFLSLRLYRQYSRLPAGRRPREYVGDMVVEGVFTGWIATLLYLDSIAFLLVLWK